MLKNVGRAMQNAHVGLQKSCLEALRTSTWPCLPHRAAQSSPRVPQEASYKIPLRGNPTREDRPGDMYDATTVGAVKSIGAVLGVAINGIGIFGPNDAGRRVRSRELGRSGEV